jgi:hypothetical protein
LPVVGVHVASAHEFDAVASPGRPQEPVGHCELTPATVQTPPAFVPPWQRSPPQVRPPVQSASELHGSAASDAQVSQKHLLAVKPVARQLGLAAVSVFVAVPVVFVRSIGKDASTLVLGRQSRLVVPK